MLRGTLLKALEGPPTEKKPIIFSTPPPASTAVFTDIDKTSTYAFRPAIRNTPSESQSWGAAGPAPAAPPPTTQTASYPVQPAAPPEKKRGPWAGIVITTLAVATLVAGAILVRVRLGANRAVVPLVALQIATMPRGASVRVNGELKCTSDCALSLPRGNYQIEADLEGYQRVAQQLALSDQPAALNVTLEPHPATVQIVTDLRRGMVVLDNRPPASLDRGGYTFEKVEPGRHTVKTTGPDGEASFSFDLAPAKLPGIMGTVNARNIEAVLVASFASRARVVTSSGPWKLAVNGRVQRDDAGPAGVDLSSFDPGQEELVIEQGSDRRSMKGNFSAAPTLTAFLTPDPKGVLIVSTGEEEVRVFVNGEEYPQRTAHGELRIPALGPMRVRVMKEGFESPPEQTADLKKAATVRLEFKMNPLR